MTEVRNLSNNLAVRDGTFQPHSNYGLFAKISYSEGDAILTESPLLVLSAASSSVDDVRSQIKGSALSGVSSSTLDSGKLANDGEGMTRNNNGSKSSLSLSDLVLPRNTIDRLSSSNSSRQSVALRTNKLRGMIIALACYAANPPSDDINERIFQLHHPSSNEDKDGDDAMELARLALHCGKEIASPGSKLSNLLKNNSGNGDKYDAMTKLLLIYSCNAFEGGRLYHMLSRVNHSCNPNAVVCDSPNNTHLSVLKAACDIYPGDEICISYLGKYLYAGYPIRQKLLRASKHFVCRCDRCDSYDARDGDKEEKDGIHSSIRDLASPIPCPICHPRKGRYLDEDVMFDEDANDDNGLKVWYATPANGLVAEDRSLYCPHCKGTTDFLMAGVSVRKKKEGMAIGHMCMAEDKVFDRLESNNTCIHTRKNTTNRLPSTIKGHVGDDDADTERDIDQQFLQMATSICGARHWTSHLLNLSLVEESLASFHSTLLSFGQDPNKDTEVMDELFVDIAEAADGIERAHEFATTLKLNLDPAHWLFDYIVGLARALVGLGDVKSQKYGAAWIERVEKYSENFESIEMRKVVIALRDAWKRGKSEEGKNRRCLEDKKENKRRKAG